MSNGSVGNGIMDLPGTIDPSALNSAALAGPHPVAPPSRGLKRSRSPDTSYVDAPHPDAPDADDTGKPRKRGRPPKAAKVAFAGSPTRAMPPAHAGIAPPVQTPQLQTSPLPHTSPSHASPSAKSTPTKPAVVKALPTVRDHTTDQLNPEGDEYIPREIDDAGERKVTLTGHPLENREYRCRTFFVPNRGDKLFMLATECARVLGYRDSYLLFNKNRSLYKIIATQAEKDDLIHQEILPYSYRSRQIAIVTARSMFRQFGSRLVMNGRRVRDDYWESKARKQGFTEEDAAGEKRPGAAKAREAAAAEANHASAMAFAHPGAFAGANADYLGAASNPLQPFGGLTPAPHSMPIGSLEPYNQRTTTDLQPRDYSGVQRPRHELTGAPYQDTTRPSPSGEILNQAAQTVEINKQFEQQRKNRKQYLDDLWNRPHEPPAQPERPLTADGNQIPQVSQAIQSPRMPSTSVSMPGNQYGMPAQTPQRPNQGMGVQSYRPQSLPQNNMVPSPMAQQHTPLPNQMHRRPPSLGMPQGMSPGMGQGGMLPGVQNPGQGYAPTHMWQGGPPQPSPLSQQHNMQQYAQRPPQQSPHPQQSPMHASPQMHHAQSSGSMHGTQMPQYQTMNAMGSTGFPNMDQNPYQPSPSPHQFMQHQSGAGQQPGMYGMSQPQSQQGWQSY
ncbi:chromatin remodelling complex Rsc7/Swp82 subunit-domain-containing protein [Boeremia exigua]|uniref:chromatin remodelling complex Rsc7/Swp82 subunit-domain-containing protein n=1 Tax=Boeremia exigua TaxID=749465 RepID=UPI001E8DE782|nr:chromatin remodelling complex Rsc7/Swp82 subunit-domain-containing protein [Boeremia exigua]KAH6615039.1 chromatin remodelling complex Rsc7/Swp82 subunit-domain-containing protein [Boeremia exigua]